MSNETGKITTTTGQKIFLDLNPGEMKKLKSGLLPIFSKIDTNADTNISNEEVSVFNKKVSEFAGTDGVLDDNEAQKLAESYGFKNTEAMKDIGLTNVDIIKFILNYTGSDAIAENMEDAVNIKWYQFGKEKNVDKFKQLFNEIDKTNVAFVYYQYRANSLSEEVFDNFNEKDSIQMIKQLYNVMLSRAKEKNIPTKELEKQIQRALNGSDKQAISNLMDELATRLYSAETAPINALCQGKVPTKLTDKNKSALIKIAKESNVKIINPQDLAGDGILGNSESKPTVNSSVPEVKNILNVVNKLMEHPVWKEKLQSRVRKEGSYLITDFPKKQTVYVIRENSIINNEGKLVEDGVVGDGDMSNFVISIYDEIQEDGKAVILNNPEALRNYIVNLF